MFDWQWWFDKFIIDFIYFICVVSFFNQPLNKAWKFPDLKFILLIWNYLKPAKLLDFNILFYYNCYYYYFILLQFIILFCAILFYFILFYYYIILYYFIYIVIFYIIISYYYFILFHFITIVVAVVIIIIINFFFKILFPGDFTTISDHNQWP